MGLLDGGLARVLGGAMAGFYLDGNLHRVVLTDDDEGGGTAAFAEPEPCKAQIDKVVQRLYEGNLETFQSIIVLQIYQGEQLADPSEDDEISIGTGRYSISMIEQDPARSYWLLMCRNASADFT
jgi:hypothetical protein